MRGLWLLALLASACGTGDDDGAFDGAVAMAIIPDDLNTALDRKVQLQFALRNEDGDYFPVETAKLAWDSSKIAIDEAAIAEPLVAGDVTFEAEAEGITGKATFHVMDRRPVTAINQTLAVGTSEACYIAVDNSTYCMETTTTPVLRTQDPFISIASSNYTACGLRADGTAVCGLEPRSTIIQLTLTNLISITSWAESTFAAICGLTRAGETACANQLPYQTASVGLIPAGLSKHGRCTIGTNYRASCAPTRTNNSEDVGAEGDYDVEYPTGQSRVYGDYFWKSIADGSRYSCGITLENKAYCWGLSEYGSLGTEVPEEICGLRRCLNRPVPVAGDRRWLALAAGEVITCGLDENGKAWCWGTGPALGDPVLETTRVPIAVSGDHVFNQIDVGTRFACASKANGELWCWGIVPGTQPPAQARTPRKITLPSPVKTP